MSGDRSATRGWFRIRILASAIGAIVSLVLNATSFAQGLSQAQTSRSSYFYRMVIETAYKGEPLTIDVVVACRVRITSSRLTGTSRDPIRMPSPLYAVRMPDNKAVAVQTVDACDGQTSDDGRVPPDFLPFMIVYSNADEMTFGIGYVSEYAYQNKTAELARPKATIRRATEQEWRRWRATAPRNALRPEMIERRFAPGRTVFGHVCSSFIRLEIPESVRAEVASLRPIGANRYWTLGHSDQKLGEILITRARENRAKSPLYSGHSWQAFGVHGRGPAGIPTRGGGGEIKTRANSLTDRSSAPAFPIREDLGVPWVGPHLRQKDVFYTDVVVESADIMGFAFCYAPTIPSEAGFGGPFRNVPGPGKQVLRFDGQIVESDDHWPIGFLVLDRDQFVFRSFVINLSGIEGID